MREMMSLVNRNMKKYFRDKGVLIFSLLSVFIVSALYMFFLADMQIDYIKEKVGDVDGIANFINTWVVAGLVCIPAVSVPLIILCFKVDDVVDGTEDDLNVTPAKRISIMMGYVLSAVIVGLIMSLICLALGEVFIVVKGGGALSFVSLLKVIGMIALIVVSFACFEFFIILFMKTNSGVSVANSVLNILLGFLLGLYVPVGMLGDGAGSVIKAFPLIQPASIIRKILMEESINKVFYGVPAEAVNQVKEMYGINIIIGNVPLTNTFIIALLILFGIIFYMASLAVIKRRKAK